MYGLVVETPHGEYNHNLYTLYTQGQLERQCLTALILALYIAFSIKTCIIFLMKLTERHVIPKPCEKCPRLQKIGYISEIVDIIQGQVFDLVGGRFDGDRLNQQLRALGVPLTLDREDIDEIMREVPDMLGAHADEIFNALLHFQEGAERSAQQFEAGCPGVLRMRATDKLGYVVTATVCGSPKVRTSIDPTLESMAAVSVEFRKP